MFGVSGLDAAGRPLAGTTIDRWLSADPRALGDGIALPFAMALLEYDLDPQQLAMDVASGAIDLSLESELLREPTGAPSPRRRPAPRGAAVERIDAQRTVRRETIDMLGEADRPWLGMTLREPDMEDAIDAAIGLVAAGIDLIRVEIPIGRELADRMADAGMTVPQWQPRRARRAPGTRARRTGPDRQPAGPRPTARTKPTGPPRERRAYVRLATVGPGPRGAGERRRGCVRTDRRRRRPTR